MFTKTSAIRYCVAQDQMSSIKSAASIQHMSSGFPTGNNRVVEPEKMARDLKSRIKEVEGLYYLCSD